MRWWRGEGDFRVAAPLPAPAGVQLSPTSRETLSELEPSPYDRPSQVHYWHPDVDETDVRDGLRPHLLVQAVRAWAEHAQFSDG